MVTKETRIPPPNGNPRWTIETVLDHVVALLDSYDKRYEQRFEASQKALELGFSAQKAAVDAAFAAAGGAVNAAFVAQKDAVNAALAAADRGVQKAELAADKRFESVNEFRATLADQQRTLIPRSEVIVMITALSEKIDTTSKQMEKIQAERAGMKGGWGYAVGLVGFMLALLSLAGLVMKFLSDIPK